MPRAQRRITEHIREYQGQRDAEPLVNWLNFTKDTAAKKRILNVIGMFMLLAGYEIQVGREHYTGEDGNTYETVTSGTKARDHVTRQLDKALGYYTMRPKVSIFGGGNKAFSPSLIVWWTPVSGSKMHRHQKAHYDPSGGIWLEDEDSPLPGTSMAESGAIKTVLELMESGALSGIDLCRCRKFFYRRFSHQRFCSSKCRIAEFRNSDEARQKRNTYARKLYHLHKKLDSRKK